MVMKISCLLLLFLQLLALSQCAPYSLEETHLLSGTASTTITCVIYGGVNSKTIKWQHDGQEIPVDNIKYQFLSNTRLQIKDISSSDEGLYSCSYDINGRTTTADIVCIYVLGAAEFSSAETTTINVFSGESAALDTRVMYTGAGRSNSNQTVTVLHLFKVVNGILSPLVYFCGDENSRKGVPCPSTSKVTATSGTHKYDLSLSLLNVTLEDGGQYQARLELLRPGVSSRTYIRKEFIIRVHDVPSTNEGNDTVNTSSVFQITIGPVSSVECSIWYDADKSAAMETTIRRGIAGSVSQHCNCEVSAEDFATGRLRCHGEWLSYRSSVKSMGREDVILAGIDEWTVSDGPSIALGIFTLQVNTLCSGRRLMTC